MPFQFFLYCAILASPLIASFSSAMESECVTVSIFGVDGALDDEIRRELRTELKIPLYKGEGPDACWHLAVELQDKTANISLANQGVFVTELDLENFIPALWPRAIALSTSGLWILAQTQADQASPNGRKTTPQREGEGGRGEERGPPTEKQGSPEEPEAGGESRAHSGSALHRLRFQVMTEVRLIPKLRVGVLEGDLGVGATVSSVYVDLCLLGLWGRKSLDSGRIVTAGVGLRGAAFWQGIRSKNISLGIGPAVEVIGLFGYGRGSDGVASKKGFSPVINFLLLMGGWFELSRSAMAHVAIGGGWSAMYFNMQVDGKTVSGIGGGFVNFLLGFSFGRSNQASPR